MWLLGSAIKVAWLMAVQFRSQSSDENEDIVCVKDAHLLKVV